MTLINMAIGALVLAISEAGLYKRMILPSQYWTVRVKQAVRADSLIECASRCLLVQCDFYIMDKKSQDCRLGDAKYLDGTSTGADVSGYISMDSLSADIEAAFMRLHDIFGHESWQPFIYKTDATLVDRIECASACIFFEGPQCQIYAFDGSACFFGNFATTNGILSTSAPSMDIYTNRDALAAKSLSKFGNTTYNLPGSVWRNFTLWTTELTTNASAIECSGFCFFQDPNPSECTFSLYTDSKVCALGSFQVNTADASSTSLFDPASYYQARVTASEADIFVSSLFSTYVSSRWNPLVFDVLAVSTTYSNECGLICYVREECEFYIHSATSCHLGNFSTTSPVSTTLVGAYTLSIYYGRISALPSEYSKVLDLVDSNLPMSRLMVASSLVPSNVDECGAFCSIAAPDCMLFYFDADSSTCFAGMMSSTATSSFSGAPGTTSLFFHSNRLVAFVDSFYTDTKSFSSFKMDVAIYASKESQLGFQNEDCAAYCFIDIRCTAYYILDTNTCNLLDFNLNTGNAQTSIDISVKWSQTTLLVWRDTAFTPTTSSGTKWTLYISQSVAEAANSLDCAVWCNFEPTCDYYVFTSGCYLGSYATTTSILSPSSTVTTYIKRQSSSGSMAKKSLFDSYNQFEPTTWPIYVYTSYVLKSGLDDQCAGICLIHASACHFYYFSGDLCFLGDFSRIGNTILGTTSGPIQMLPNSYNFRSQVSGFGGSSTCSGSGFREVTSSSWTISIDLQYVNSAACYWYIYNPNPTGYFELTISNYNSESCCDSLSVFMGPSTAYPLRYIYSGNLLTTTRTWTGTPLTTIFWRTDGSVTYSSMVGTLRYKV